MEPDSTKVSAVCDWPIPTNSSELCSFLGLASYYRRYIHRFANIAAPLYQRTTKGAVFTWDEACQLAFTQKLSSYFPSFDSSTDQFILMTDASATGIRAILEQGRWVVAHASRTLSASERNYSVIQRECLAIVYALKQFKHHLLGHKFQLVTDHAPTTVALQPENGRFACPLSPKNLILPFIITRVWSIAMLMPYLTLQPQHSCRSFSPQYWWT